MNILKWSIIGVMILLGINLYQTIVNLDTSFVFNISNEILALETTVTEKWALRGQVGDIMSGHFSALAFLAVALSILFQYEANKQMKESIEKQNKEFLINSLENKINRYFALFDVKIKEFIEPEITEYANIKLKNSSTHDINIEKFLFIMDTRFKNILDLLELIYDEINTFKEEEKLYKTLIDEFKLKINGEVFLITIKGFYPKSSTYSVCKLIEQEDFAKKAYDIMKKNIPISITNYSVKNYTYDTSF